MTAHVAVVVPGALGSVLKLGDEVVWPDPFMNFASPEKQVEKLLHPKVEPSDVIRSFMLSRQYQALIDVLEAWKFHEKASPPTLRLVPYDWRKSYSEAAERVAKTIDEIAASHNDDCRISIVAHSMGGMACRYYLESGGFDKRRGFPRVGKLITLGTPHRGAPYALAIALGKQRRLFLSGPQIKKVADEPGYPAVYEGFPPSDEPFIWNEAPKAALKTLRLDDPALIKQLGLSEVNLKEARAFQGKLDLRRRPKEVRYFCFVGSRQPTACATLLMEDVPSPRVKALMQDDSGDGIVPIWSAGLPGVQMRPVGGEHGTLYKNAELRSALFILLEVEGTLWAPEGTVEIAIRDRVVEPETPFSFLLTLPRGTKRVTGELRVERPVEQEQGIEFVVMPKGTNAITYGGPTVESFSLEIQAPSYPGQYRLAFYDPAGKSLGSDEFFVQVPG